MFTLQEQIERFLKEPSKFKAEFRHRLLCEKRGFSGKGRRHQPRTRRWTGGSDTLKLPTENDPRKRSLKRCNV